MFLKSIVCFLLLFVCNLQASNSSSETENSIKIQILQKIESDLKKKADKRYRDYQAIEAGRTPSPEAVDNSISENGEIVELQSKIKEHYKTLATIDAAIETAQETQAAYQNYMAARKNHLY